MANNTTVGPYCGYTAPSHLMDGTNALNACSLAGVISPPLQSVQSLALRIKEPRNGDKFRISKASVTMPKITCEVGVVGIYPDPSNNLEFFWKAQVKYDSGGCPNGTNGQGSTFKTSSEELSGSCAGGKFNLQFETLSGGDLTVDVWVFIGGRRISTKLSGVRIEGENPDISQIAAVISRPVIGQIISHESSVKQFVVANSVLYPLWSGDRKLGVGLGQITNPPPNQLEVWDWRANVRAIEKKFTAALGSASRYPDHCRKSEVFKQLQNDVNERRKKNGLKTVKVILPDFNSDQLERDAVRCYNGAAGNDDMTNAGLHEYRVKLDSNEDLFVSINENALVAKAEWVVVAPSERPRVGDPNYVTNVYSKQPL